MIIFVVYYIQQKRGETNMETIMSYHSGNAINVASLARNRRTQQVNLLPAETTYQDELAIDHTSEPIKSVDTINEISQYLISQERYRDNMLFIVGINFGLRISDLLKLRFCHIINDNMTFKESFGILEQKTRNTRKVQKNRYITINDAVIESVTLYLQHNLCKLDDFMFRGESNRCGSGNKPMTRGSVDRILKGIATEMGLSEKISTHSLRKTFGYHQMMMSNNDPRKLIVLQKMFGHSSSAQTLDYIGITDDEMVDAYLNLNLGTKYNYAMFSQLHEAKVG